VESWHARYYYRWYRAPRLPDGLPILSQDRLHRWSWRFSWAQPALYVWPLPRDAGIAVGVRRLRTPFGPSFRCYVGSQWFAINRHALDVLLDVVRSRGDLMRYYARTIVSDESLIPSVLMNDPRVRIATPNVSYLRFDTPQSAHPATLTIDDLGAIDASGAFFARKVDGLDQDLLAALDERARSALRAR
jgi:hypothetical protein